MMRISDLVSSDVFQADGLEQQTEAQSFVEADNADILHDK